MRKATIIALCVFCGFSANAQQEIKLRPDIPPCFTDKLPLLDDGKADVASVVSALMFECHVDLVRYYANLSRLPMDDLKLTRIMEGNRNFDLGRAASAVLAARVRAQKNR